MEPRPAVPRAGRTLFSKKKCKIHLSIFSAQSHLCLDNVPIPFIYSQIPLRDPLPFISDTALETPQEAKFPFPKVPGMRCPHLGPPHTHPSSTHCPKLHLTLSELCSRSSVSSSPLCSSRTSVVPFLGHFSPLSCWFLSL